MQVECPSCKSRYQFPDSKIKPTGTKVRCPSCRHTFLIFAEEDDQAFNEKTEIFDISKHKIRPASADVNIEKEENTTPTTKRKVEPAFSDPSIMQTRMRDQPVEKAASPFKAENKPVTEAISQILGRVTEEEFKDLQSSPFARPQFQAPAGEDPIEEAMIEPSYSDHDDVIRQPAPQPPTEVSPRVTAGDPRPFGDATYFEIQKSTPKKSWAGWGLAGIALGVGLATAYFLNQPKEKEFIEVEAPRPPSAPRIVLSRPSEWRAEDPKVYQDLLTQLAVLSKDEQQLPENRSLIADSLINLGVLTDNLEQTNSGLSMASSLMATQPPQIFGFYPLMSYGFWKADTTSLRNLYQNWPDVQREDLEFKFLGIVLKALDGQIADFFKEMKEFLSQNENYQKAKWFTLTQWLRHPSEALAGMGAEWEDRLFQDFEKTRALYKQRGLQLPNVYKTIEQTFIKNGKIGLPEAVVTAPTTSPTQKNQTSDSPQVKAAPKSKQPTKLPKPSKDLLAQNSQTQTQTGEAERFYRQGLELSKRSRMDEALTSYRQALRLNPDFADVYREIGKIYMAKKDKDRALRSLKIYLQLKPGSTDKRTVESWISSLQ